MPLPTPPNDVQLAAQALRNFASVLDTSGNATVLRDRLAAKQAELKLRLENKGTTHLKEYQKSLKELQANTTFAGRSIGDLAHHSILGAQALSDTIKSFKNLDVASESVAKQLNEQFAKAGITYGKSITDLADVLQFQEGHKALENLVKAQKRAAIGAAGGATQFDKLRRGILDSDLPKHFKDIALTSNVMIGHNLGAQHALEALSTAAGNAAANTMTLGASVRDGASTISKTLGQALKDQISKYVSVTDGLKRMQAALEKGAEGLSTQVKFGSSLGALDFQIRAAALHIDQIKLAELEGKFRQVGTAMGGTGAFLDQLKMGQEQFRNFTSTAEEAAQVWMGSADVLSRSGIKPTVKRLQGMGNQIRNFTKLGVDANETLEIYNEVQADGVTRAQLLTATTQDERNAIIQSNAARVLEFKAIGMTTDQARGAAKALSDLSSKTVTQRLQIGAQAQQVGGITGVQGGAEFAQIMRMGKAAFVGEGAEERIAKVLDFVGKVQEIKAKAEMSGNIGLQRFAEIITEVAPDLESVGQAATDAKLALKGERGVVKGANGEITGDLLKASKAQVDAMKTVTDVSKPTVDAMHTLQNALTSLRQPITQLGLGVAQIVAGTVWALLGTAITSAIGAGIGTAAAVGGLAAAGTAFATVAVPALVVALAAAIGIGVTKWIKESTFGKTRLGKWLTTPLWGEETPQKTPEKTAEFNAVMKARGLNQYVEPEPVPAEGAPAPVTPSQPAAEVSAEPVGVPVTPSQPAVASNFENMYAAAMEKANAGKAAASSPQAIIAQTNNDLLTTQGTTLAQVANILSEVKMTLAQLLKGQTDHFAWIQDMEGDALDVQRRAVRLGGFSPQYIATR